MKNLLKLIFDARKNYNPDQSDKENEKFGAYEYFEDLLKNDKTIETKIRNYKETLADIAHDATLLGFNTHDSRLTIDLFIQWADEFDELHQDTDWNEIEYIDTIEAFTQRKMDEFNN